MNDGYCEVVHGSTNNILFEYDEITEKCIGMPMARDRGWFLYVW